MSDLTIANPVEMLPEKYAKVKNVPYRGRCKRCNRSIKIKTVGQVYGPICEKRIMEDLWTFYMGAIRENKAEGQLCLDHFVHSTEVV